MLDVYPVITYNDHTMIDISKRFAVTNIETDNSKSIYFWHVIKGWKSPENVAYDFYGSCDYVWVLLSLNNVINPVDDWLLSDEELRLRMEEKYGNKLYDVHHYEKDGIMYAYPLDNTGKPILTSKERVEMIPSDATPVSNYEYEYERNEKKRRIKILYPELLSTIEHEVRSLFK